MSQLQDGTDPSILEPPGGDDDCGYDDCSDNDEVDDDYDEFDDGDYCDGDGDGEQGLSNEN